MNNVIWLLRFAAPASARLAVSVTARIVGQLLGMLVLALPCWAIGMLATGQAQGAGFVAAVAGIVALAAICKAGLRYLEQLTGHLAAFSLLGELRIWLLDRLIPRAPATTEALGAARIHAIAVRDVDRIEVFFAHTIAPAITAVIVPIVAVVAAWWLGGSVLALVLIAVLAGGLALLLGTVHLGESAQLTATARAGIAAHVADSARLRDEFRMHDATEFRADELRDLDKRLRAQLLLGGRNAAWRGLGSDLRVWGGTVLMLVVALTGLTDAAQLPGALAVVSFVASTAPSIDSVVRLASSLPAGLAATARVRELANVPRTVTEPEAPASLPLPVAANDEGAVAEPHEPEDIDDTDVPAIEFDSVSATYRQGDQRTPVLEQVSFTVPSGTSFGIVGVSGSGKSTIARLVQRHLDPSAGTVRLHGVDARELGSAQVQQLVAIADQDAFVLDATVAENLRLASPDASDAELEHACSIAQFELPLTTEVGRRGAKLSGGQRQRLAIARTLVRLHGRADTGECGGSQPDAGTELHHRILILDEATSHQDPLTQSALVTAIADLGVTTLVIAHRLETVRQLDQLIVVESGCIVQQGTWQELAQVPGRFRDLLTQQLAA